MWNTLYTNEELVSYSNGIKKVASEEDVYEDNSGNTLVVCVDNKLLNK